MPPAAPRRQDASGDTTPLPTSAAKEAAEALLPGAASAERGLPVRTTASPSPLGALDGTDAAPGGSAGADVERTDPAPARNGNASAPAQPPAPSTEASALQRARARRETCPRKALAAPYPPPGRPSLSTSRVRPGPHAASLPGGPEPLPQPNPGAQPHAQPRAAAQEAFCNPRPRTATHADQGSSSCKPPRLLQKKNPTKTSCKFYYQFLIASLEQGFLEDRYQQQSELPPSRVLQQKLPLEGRVLTFLARNGLSTDRRCSADAQQLWKTNFSRQAWAVVSSSALETSASTPDFHLRSGASWEQRPTPALPPQPTCRPPAAGDRPGWAEGPDAGDRVLLPRHQRRWEQSRALLAPAWEASPQPLHPPPYQKKADGSFSRQRKDGPSQNRAGCLLNWPSAGRVPAQLPGMTEPGSVPRDAAQGSSLLARVQK